MILSDIRKYIAARGRVSLDDLVARFDGDKGAIEAMMEDLKARGKVFEPGCGSCASAKGCSVARPKIYISSDRPGSDRCEASLVPRKPG